MEALAAVGLSSNILQFVELSAKLIRTANELRHDASTAENKDHAAVAEHLEAIANGVKASAQEIEGASAAVSPEEKALLPVAEGCSALAQDLLRRLKACGVGTQQTDKRFNRAKRALKCMWNKREIDEINARLQYFRSELGLHMTYGIKQAQAQSHASQASADDVRVIRDLVQALGAKSDANAAEILRSVAEVRVENSRFHAQASQAAPAAVGCEASLQHLMRSLFDEYEERFMEGVEKRFRGAARLEMESLRASLLQGIQEVQVGPAETARHEDYHSDHEYATADRIDEVTFKEEPRLEYHELQRPNRQRFGGLRKENISFISKARWDKSTRLGKFSLHITRAVVFSDDRPATSVYDVTVHLIPSPRWLATGYSVTYQRLTDPRGKPTLGLQLETYRILDDDHEVWGVIRSGDLAKLRTMLSQRLVSTSDRNSSGGTLLQSAVAMGQLDICKALVHSGADVNADDVLGLNALLLAFLPGSYLQANGSAIFYFLQSLPQARMEIFWDNLAGAVAVKQELHKLFGRFRFALSSEKLDEWVDVCKAVEFDFNASEFNFMEDVVLCNTTGYDRLGTSDRWHNLRDSKVSVDVFDVLVQRGIGGVVPGHRPKIPVASAAFRITWSLRKIRSKGSMRIAASPDEPMPYRGYYISESSAATLGFLEHVISTGIAGESDCIFDSYGGLTIYDIFLYRKLDHIWDQILEEHGFDPVWVREENERRKRVVLGETSAHEVKVGVDTAEVKRMKRRRAYGHEE